MTITLAKTRRDARAVCKSCHMVMDDCEPFGPRPEFFHKKQHKDGTASKCANAGGTFFVKMIKGQEMWPSEIEPFMRKRTRRAAKRVMK